MNLPENLLSNPHFTRYYRTWQRNPLSIVFIPMAQICREQGLLDEAREICWQGLQHHPDSVSGRLMLGRIYFDMEDFPKAREIVSKVLDDFPGQQEAKGLYERIRRSLGETSKNEIHQTASNPSSPWENLTMAKIYADQGESKIALEIVERILTRDPKNEKALHFREALKKCRS